MKERPALYIDRILYPVRSLGPGGRVAVWTAGCERGCAGCANPELWTAKKEQRIAPETAADLILKIIDRNDVDGLTITGGEPFLQSEKLVDVLTVLRPQIPDILIFTGYYLEELTGEAQRRMLGLADVIVDGPYEKDLNDGQAVLRGSVNQRMIILNEAVRDRYETYLKEGRIIENFVYSGEVLSVGIHSESAMENDDE